MRTAFVEELTKRALDDQRIHLVVGDLGYSVVEDFATKCPKRFINAGVSEQNMTGMSAGMAMVGERKVFTYSIANFPTIRCLEQIRNDVCYHNADVKVVSVGAGVAYGVHGYTHFGVEDLALMRSMPNMVVVSPADPIEARAVARLACKTTGPWYIRLGKNREPNLHSEELTALKVGKALQLADGDAGTVIAIGSVAYEAMTAVKQANDAGLAFRLLSMPFIKPLDEAAIIDAARNTQRIVTVEEHSGIGGLASAVAEVLARNSLQVAFSSIHLPDYIDRIGSQNYLRQSYGLDSAGILARLTETLQKV